MSAPLERMALPGAKLVSCVEAPLPTRYGALRCLVFSVENELSSQHVALVAGDVRGDDVLFRMHSECITSEVFGSLKCDCREQLDQALARIEKEGRGVLVYLRQEGRGIGLANKLRAYALQEKGLDTVDANRALGLPDDARRYDAAAAILRELGVSSVRVMTNNPDKLEALHELGVRVESRVPIVTGSRAENAGYLAAKRTRMRHALPHPHPARPACAASR